MLLFLTYRMKRGFGVDVAVHNMASRIQARGVPVLIGCLDLDDEYSDLNIIRVPPAPWIIARLARKFGVTHIVAHTSPFFEVLPALRSQYPVTALEYGDPTPELMSTRLEFQRLKENKLRKVYPHVDRVLTISKFIAADIAWPDSKVLYLGCDHVKDLGLKKFQKSGKLQKCRIGGLMRLGKGEAEYKGNELLIQLFRFLGEKIDAEFHVMGRGTEADAREFINMGIHVHLNATNDERNAYLRDLDIFISPSLWEGFNLPLVEAQAMGTMSIAFDTGSHPEVTPFVTSSLTEMAALILASVKNPVLLRQNSTLCYNFVRNKFSWDSCAGQLLSDCYPNGWPPTAKQGAHLGHAWKVFLFVLSALWVGKQYGFLKIFRQAFKRFILDRIFR